MELPFRPARTEVFEFVECMLGRHLKIEGPTVMALGRDCTVTVEVPEDRDQQVGRVLHERSKLDSLEMIIHG